HVHPITPLLVWCPVIGFLIWRSYSVNHLSVVWMVPVVFVGIFSWTLAEYILHRFVFHIEGKTPLTQRLHFLIHGLHHADPVDPTRLVMPPTASLFLGLVLYSLFRLPLGDTWVQPFFAGFLVGYLCYDYIHYAVHHFNPKTPLGRFLKQSHMQHHYVDPESHWGVSSPLWDYVFGTVEVAKRKRQTA
ncbi:MAG: sterol desaturase family protein, partial [Bdellovibrio sp.]|nr:sterol desaturase family protein [Bdellovibrio sp.]